jgi:hypothetical protein
LRLLVPKERRLIVSPVRGSGGGVVELGLITSGDLQRRLAEQGLDDLHLALVAPVSITHTPVAATARWSIRSRGGRVWGSAQRCVSPPV